MEDTAGILWDSGQRVLRFSLQPRRSAVDRKLWYAAKRGPPSRSLAVGPKVPIKFFNVRSLQTPLV